MASVLWIVFVHKHGEETSLICRKIRSHVLGYQSKLTLPMGGALLLYV